MTEKDKLLAIFIDVENAFPDFSGEKLRCLFDHFAGIGVIALCRGYADWSKLAAKKGEAFKWNIATINLFVRGEARKNAADIAIAVDAMEELHTVKEITTFVIIGGDSDLAPLATKLREKGKEVIGISRRDVVSPYFLKACTNFVYLDDLVAPTPKKAKNGKEKQLETTKEILKRLIGGRASRQINAGTLKVNLLGESPSFNEKKYGFRTFGQFLDSFPEFQSVRSATGSLNIKLAEDTKEGGLEAEAQAIEEKALPLNLEEAQDVLIRAIKSSRKPDGHVDAAGLKSTMLRMAPRFSEKALGFYRFTDFLVAQKGLVKIQRIAPGQYIVELLES